MKAISRFLQGLLPLTLLIAGSVHAAHLTAPIEGSRIRMIGRGIQNKATGDSIAIACLDESCIRLSNAYFNAKTFEVTYFGQVIEVNAHDSAATRKEIKRSVKEINKAYKQFKRSHQSDEAGFLRWLGYSGATAGYFYVSINMLPAVFMTSFALSAIAWGIIPFAGGYLLAKSMFIGGKGGMVSQVFADDQGWNWESHPRRVSPSVFESYESFVRSGWDCKRRSCF